MAMNSPALIQSVAHAYTVPGQAVGLSPSTQCLGSAVPLYRVHLSINSFTAIENAIPFCAPT
eukprot:3653728-Pyramimonas_sp.AAC.1